MVKPDVQQFADRHTAVPARFACKGRRITCFGQLQASHVRRRSSILGWFREPVRWRRGETNVRYETVPTTVRYPSHLKGPRRFAGGLRCPAPHRRAAGAPWVT